MSKDEDIALARSVLGTCHGFRGDFNHSIALPILYYMDTAELQTSPNDLYSTVRVSTNINA